MNKQQQYLFLVVLVCGVCGVHQDVVEKLLVAIPSNTRTQYQPESFDSAAFWEKRYASGDTSGSGSYGVLAEYKAAVLNKFVEQEHVELIVEFGFGDGNQLSMAKYPQYFGLDVSPSVFAATKTRFVNDTTKHFAIYDGRPVPGLTADLVVSLDVLYHLIEQRVYVNYLVSLFEASSRFVIIYACDENRPQHGSHVLFRRFTDDVKFLYRDLWTLDTVLDNPHATLTPAKFYVFKRSQ